MDVERNPGSSREAWSRPTVRVDWLQGSVLPCDPETGDRLAPTWLNEGAQRSGTPRGVRGYDRWYMDDLTCAVGERLDASLGHDALPLRGFVILKGSGLARFRAAGWDCRDTLELWQHWEGRCTRLDIAIDVKHPEVTPEAWWRRYEEGRIVTRLAHHRFEGTEGGGKTFYLMGKDLLLRVYDKSAERARVGAFLEPGVTRIELQMKQRSALAAVRQLLAVPAEAWEAEFPRLSCGWVLDKARPLEGQRPARNPQRAPTWGALEEAFAGVQPVALGRDEADRNYERHLASQMQHFARNTGHLKLMRETLGVARFEQAIEQGKVSQFGHMLKAFAQDQPETFERIVRAYGIRPPDEPDEPEANEDTPSEEGGLLWDR